MAEQEGRTRLIRRAEPGNKAERKAAHDPTNAKHSDVSHLSHCTVKESIEKAVSKVQEEEQEELLLECAKSIVTEVVLKAKKIVENEQCWMPTPRHLGRWAPYQSRALRLRQRVGYS